MTATPSTPYDWIRQLPTSLLRLDGVPLFGYAPDFPWDEVASALKDILELDSLIIQPQDSQWRSEEELTSGLPQEIQPYTITIPSIGTLYFALPKEELRGIMIQMLNNGDSTLEAINGDFEKGFSRFLLLETLHAIRSTPFGQELPFQIEETESLPTEACFCRDLSISLNGKQFEGRLFVPASFRKAWSEKYADRSTRPSLHPELAASLSVTVHLEAGALSMNNEQLAQLHPGDFVLIDRCSLKPGENKGRLMLTIHGRPFFRGRIRNGKLKLLEIPQYQEMDETMARNFDEEENESFDDDEEEELTFDEETSDEEEELDEFTEEEGEEEANEEPEEAVAEEAEESAETVGTASQAPAEPFTPPKPEELGFDVVIEVGRLEMTMQQLMDLSPGNLLELNVAPEDGIDLVVQGKRIAKGELLRVGETLGVRILDMK